jgi:hypothetical protein
MKAFLSGRVRAVVLAALAPMPVLACGGETTPIPGGGSGTAGATNGASSGVNGNSGVASGNSGSITGITGGITGGISGGIGTGSSGGITGVGCAGNSYSGPLPNGCMQQWIQGDPQNGGEVLFPCGLPAPTANPQCTDYCTGSMANNCEVVCTSGTTVITAGLPWTDSTDGSNPVVVQCNYVFGTGRRPAGLAAPEARPARFAGELLASQAYLERASVDAFLELAEQVAAHGAPARLVERLRRAASEEVEHARVVGELARARGCEPPPVDVTPAGPRSLLAIALENAREGCVRETWGAAVAVAQGERAGDGDVREAMLRIARDELGHAALSWDLAAWLETRLSAQETRAVAEERARAVTELEGEIEQALPLAWTAALGVPSREEARAIFAGMREAVWSADA